VARGRLDIPPREKLNPILESLNQVLKTLFLVYLHKTSHKLRNRAGKVRQIENVGPRGRNLTSVL